jgi:hypothetical protein
MFLVVQEGKMLCRVFLRLDRNFNVNVWRFVLRQNFDVTVGIAFNFCVGETNLCSFVILYVG